MKYNISLEDYDVTNLTSKEKKLEPPKKTTKSELEEEKEENQSSEIKATDLPERTKKLPQKPKGEKHPGGRPKKEITRKQYTLTLKEEDYKVAMKYATERDISFAKLVETALKNYIGF